MSQYGTGSVANNSASEPHGQRPRLSKRLEWHKSDSLREKKNKGKPLIVNGAFGQVL